VHMETNKRLALEWYWYKPSYGCPYGAQNLIAMATSLCK